MATTGWTWLQQVWTWLQQVWAWLQQVWTWLQQVWTWLQHVWTWLPVEFMDRIEEAYRVLWGADWTKGAPLAFTVKDAVKFTLDVYLDGLTAA
eukprot:7061062-Pyramimonas_sp.AAC.2